MGVTRQKTEPYEMGTTAKTIVQLFKCANNLPLHIPQEIVKDAAVVEALNTQTKTKLAVTQRFETVLSAIDNSLSKNPNLKKDMQTAYDQYVLDAKNLNSTWEKFKNDYQSLLNNPNLAIHQAIASFIKKYKDLKTRPNAETEIKNAEQILFDDIEKQKPAYSDLDRFTKDLDDLIKKSVTFQNKLDVTYNEVYIKLTPAQRQTLITPEPSRLQPE